MGATLLSLTTLTPLERPPRLETACTTSPTPPPLLESLATSGWRGTLRPSAAPTQPQWTALPVLEDPAMMSSTCAASVVSSSTSLTLLAPTILPCLELLVFLNKTLTCPKLLVLLNKTLPC